jgi:hypothetical protein
MLVGRVIVDDPMNYLASCTPPRTAFSRADGRLMCLLWRIAGPAHLGGRILIACAAPFGWRPPPPLTRAANCARGFSRQRAIPQAACGRTWPVSRQRSLLMEKNGFRSRVHHKKPKGRAIPEGMPRAHNAKSKIRSRVERVFAGTEGLNGPVHPNHRNHPARGKIGLANLVYNLKRLIFLQRRFRSVIDGCGRPRHALSSCYPTSSRLASRDMEGTKFVVAWRWPVRC